MDFFLIWMFALFLFLLMPCGIMAWREVFKTFGWIRPSA